jgi:hypothetical protein
MADCKVLISLLHSYNSVQFLKPYPASRLANCWFVGIEDQCSERDVRLGGDYDCAGVWRRLRRYLYTVKPRGYSQTRERLGIHCSGALGRKEW